MGVLGGGAYLLSKRSQVPEKIRTKSSEATRLLVRRARIAKGRRVATLIRNNPWRKTDDWRPSAPQAIRIANGGPVENETIKTKSTRNSRAREAFKRKMSKGE